MDIQPLLILVFLAVIFIGLFIGGIVPRLSHRWDDYSERIEAKQLKKLARKASFRQFRGSSEGAAWPSATIRFHDNYFIFKKRGQTSRFAYTNLRRLSFDTATKIHFHFSNPEQDIVFVTSSPEELVNTVRKYHPSARLPLQSVVLKVELVSAFKVAASLLPLFAFTVYFLITHAEPEDSFFANYHYIFIFAGYILIPIGTRFFRLREVRTAENNT